MDGLGSTPGTMRRAVLVAATWCCVLVAVTPTTPPGQEVPRETHTASSGKDSRGLFSPRMDYDEWTPLGRGDPLKNDPTYVYVPPVLERVHYWVEPSSPGTMPLGQSASERNTRPHDVPILRSTHKTTVKTEPTAESRLASFVDPFLKFIDGPKFSSTPHYYHNQPNSHNQYVMHSPYYQHMYHPKQRPNPNYEVQPHNSGSFQQREPYTMLVPPPVQAAATFIAVQTEPTTTTTEIPTTFKTTIEIGKGNLIYHSSTVSDWVEGKTQLATLAAASNHVTWKTSAQTTNQSNTMKPTQDTQMSVGSSTEAITKIIPTTKEVSNQNKEDPVKMELPPPIEDMGPLLASLLKNEWTTTMTTTTPPNIITVTTVPSLTTDPLFSHYKQPAEPMRGPMYLIIQGHSKVKTYGASNAQSYHGIPVQETNDIHQEGVGDIDRSGRGVDEDIYEDGNEGGFVLENKTEASCQDEKSGCNKKNRKEEKVSKRKKRQLEIDDLIPIEEAGLLLEEFLEDQREGSGIGALLADSISGRSEKRTT